VARTTPVKKAWRSLAWLLIIIAGLAGVNAYGVVVDGAGWTPKLALDLEGGTQIILAPKLESGETVTQEELDQAVAIIRQRVDSSGVSEAEINTQGGQNIVVSIPGTPDDQTLQRIQQSAKLDFRAVICASDSGVAPTEACTPTTPTASPTDSPTPNPTETAQANDGTGSAGEDTTPTPTPTADPATNDPDLDGSDERLITPELLNEYSNVDCEALANSTEVAPENEPLVACNTDGTAAYILGPVEVRGANIADATSGAQTNSQGGFTGSYAINLTFDAEGSTAFGKVTTRLFAIPDGDPRNRFAIVLDGSVISAPSTNAAITGGKAEISGSFTQASAKTLASQLKYGALPLSFEVQSKDAISATLGTTQLVSGLIAGLIGLILVVIYSLVQYRALASVTIMSLIIAAIITYLIVTFLSWREGYRLSLAGVAGLIVAIGITADSFIVYFERIRDELRDGRGLESAVEAGWTRAIRTIIASDAVNFLAAAVLFILAVGNVRGFALTLGLTTVVDLIVVSLFTHPMLQLFARTRFFGGGHVLSGLDPDALGAVYRGRAKFQPRVAATGKVAASQKEAARRQTIAERKAAESASGSSSSSSSSASSSSSKRRTKGKDS
jgi:preprotein translocase subunit SecD